MKRPLRHLSWIITVPLGIIVISFAVSNRAPLVLTLWPLPFEWEMPTFLPVLVGMVAGFVVGGAVAWWTGGRYRRLARRQGSRLRALTAEVETLRASTAETAEAATRKQEAERLEAATQASEISAQREEAAAPRQLVRLGSR